MLALVSSNLGPEYQRSQKKILKTLSSVWPDQSIETTEISEPGISEDERAFKIILDGVHRAYFITAKSQSKFDVFDYMVVFDLEGNIIQPKILIYREDYGGEIASKRWLKQFIGMDKTSNMSLGKEVQNIAGATISCESASRGFKQAAQSIDKIISESE
ncbi:MAG: FMN-binding protein [Flavobacteriales bacterium]|nr:FMN-binding protein [Flavobacteriales bacterium]